MVGGYLRAAGIVAGLLGATVTAYAQTAREVRQVKEIALQQALTYHPSDWMLDERRSCLMGKKPEDVRKARGFGFTLLDASDGCAVAALRTARDGNLLLPYRELLDHATGNSTGYENIPAIMATTVLKSGGDRIPVGSGRAAMLTPSLVLDAGFTMAYQQHPAPSASTPTIATLKPIAERCLAQQEPNLGLCYSTGYVYGQHAINGTLLTVLQQALQ